MTKKKEIEQNLHLYRKIITEFAFHPKGKIKDKKLVPAVSSGNI